MTSYKVKKYLKEDIVAEVPGSKSMTNRALLLAAMADGTSRLEGAAFSEDSVHFLKALESMGFKVEADEKRCTVIIEGHGLRHAESYGDKCRYDGYDGGKCWL